MADDKNLGRYRKYLVKRLRDKAGKHRNCEFFVIDERHDKFALPALRAYALACETEFPELAKDLRERRYIASENAGIDARVAELEQAHAEQVAEREHLEEAARLLSSSQCVFLENWDEHHAWLEAERARQAKGDKR